MNLLSQVRLAYGNNFGELNLVRDWIGQVYELTDKNKRYILKVFRKEQTNAAIQSVGVMQYLYNNNFSVPNIIETKEGNGYFTYKNQIVVLYECIVGKEMDKGTNLFYVGEQTGLMRKIMESYRGKVIHHDYNFFVKRYLDIMEMKEYLNAYKFIMLGNELWDRVKDLPYGFVHGDLHVGNMFVRQEKIIFYDFDACSLTSPVYDIATFCDATDYFDLSLNNFENGMLQTQKNVLEFLKGYEKYYELGKDEEKAIFDFIAIRHFDIQATIIESQGVNCVDEFFLDEQYLWLNKWKAHLL
jgi:Ser/Thr protein kinase RdoA (MazF antagonist)